MVKHQAARQPQHSTDGGDAATNQRRHREQAIVKHFRMIYQAIQRHSSWVEKKCGVSAAQLWAMWELSTAPGLRVSDLSAALAIHPSTASNMLDKLEAKNLIERRRGGPDQRVVRVYLTRAGTKLLANAPGPARGALVDALHGLSESQVIALDRGLKRLTTLLRIDDANSGLKPLD